MALNLGELYFRLGARTDGLNRAEKEARRFSRRTERHFNRTSRAASRLGGTIATLLTVDLARRTVMLADKYNVLQQRLKTATKATGDYARVASEIFAISNKNGTALETNVELFQSLARVAPELGATTSEILTLTETVGQLGVIGGSSSEQMKNGLLQFTQGLAAGILRAEEMNSILENLPEVANRIAQGMDMTVGSLRKAVINGEVLSEDVFKSLMSQSTEIAQEFKDIPLTVDRSATALSNSFSKFLSQLDQSTNTTTRLAASLDDLSRYFSGDFTKGLDGIDETFSEISDSMTLWGDLMRSAGVEVGVVGDAMSSLFGWYSKLYRRMYRTFLTLPAHIKSVFQVAAEDVRIFWIDLKGSAQNIGISFKIAWAQVQNLGAVTINFLVTMFAKAADSVLNFFSTSISNIGQMLSALPVIGNSLGGFESLSKTLKSMATNEQAVSAAILHGNIIRSERLYDLKREKAELKLSTDLKKAASHEAILAAYAERDATIQSLQAKRDARQASRDHANIIHIEEARNARAYQILVKDGEELELAALQKRANAERKQKETDAKNKKSLTPKFNSLAKSLATEQEVQENYYARSIAMLQQAEDLKIATVVPYHELRRRLEEDHQKKMDEIVARSSESRRKTEAIGAFLGVDLHKKVGDMTLKEQGQMFRSQIDQAAGHSKEFFELRKALMLATAFMEGPKAVLSAYTWGTELGGPILGSVFAGISAAATAVQIAAISSAQYRGGKATGGEVFSGGLYRVNENGAEMLSVGGSDYLMMGGQNGKVTPNNKLNKGAAGDTKVFVNVYPVEGHTARITERKTSEGTQVDVFMEVIKKALSSDIHSGGQMADAIESQYGLSRTA